MQVCRSIYAAAGAAEALLQIRHLERFTETLGSSAGNSKRLAGRA
jgi:hypothetical protein